jgi:signal peptidase I
MLPTLPLGSHVTVALDPKYVPKVGDIIIFHPPAGADPVSAICGDPRQGAGHSAACSMPTPTASKQTFIKRVVAGPGDTLQIRDGRVVRNGQREAEPYIAACGSDPICNFLTSIKISPGDYFVLGDNRGASDDSRFWGPVPRESIIGKVVKIPQ